jgi:pimeloyl-ACP methyl ester carboxylesterase
MIEFAALFPAAALVIQSGAGHFPWLDDPDEFVSAYLDCRKSVTPSGNG